MGLDTTHGCWHGSYGNFHLWRCEIASLIGINLEKMKGFDGNVPWESLKPDPLHKLLHHSDCDGEIETKDCAAIADRLESLLPQITDEYYLGKTEQFIEGLRLAASANEDVVFM